MARYTMGAGTQSGNGSSPPITIADFLAMQEEDRKTKSQKKMQWLTLGIGALGILNATAQQPIEDKRSAIDAPAIDAAASDVEDFDFTAFADAGQRAALEDFAAATAKVGRSTASAMQRGVDNNGKQGILGSATGNNNNLLLLLGLGLVLADD